MGGWLDWVSVQVAPFGLAVRAVHVVAVVAAGLVVWSLSPGAVASVVLAEVALFGVVTALRPDRELAALQLGVLVIWWALVGADAGVGPLVGFALLLAVAHLSAALASVGPAAGATTRRLTRTVARRAGGYLATVLAGIGLVLAAGSLPDAVPRGWVWVALVGVAVLTGAVVTARR